MDLKSKTSHKFFTSPTTIRKSLLRNLVLLIFITSGAILAVNVLGASQVVKKLSRSLIFQTITQKEAKLENFFDPITKQLQILQKWGQLQELDIENSQHLRSLLIPILTQNKQISSAILASSDGSEFLIVKEEEQNTWLTRLTSPKKWKNQKHFARWKNPHQLVKEWTEENDYNPLNRLWYQGAIKTKDKNQIYWTKPYTFFTVKEPGITASICWQDPKNKELSYVAGFDVLLLDISKFTTKLHVTKNGNAFVFTEEGKLLGLPKKETFQNTNVMKKAILSSIKDLELAPITQAYQKWKSNKNNSPLPFKSEGMKWWAGFHPFVLSNHTFWIGIVIPEIDLMEGIHRQQKIVFFVTLCALGLAIFMASLLAKKYSKPLEELANQSIRIRDLDLESESHIESQLLEINQLAQAQEQMLFALQSFSRYVPIEVVRELLKRGEVAKIGGRTEVLTILFTDIRGFTTIAEQMSPEAVTTQMAEYFEGMLEILHQHHATVDKFVGDAIVAFWGAPTPDTNHAQHALSAVLQCREKLFDLNKQWEARGMPALFTRFGLDTGSVVVGNVGARSRLSYTVLGDTVNLASRLEGLNRFYGTEIIVSEHVWKQSEKDFCWRYLDLVAVKGKQQPVKIFEPLGFKKDLTESQLNFAKDYEKAFHFYQNRQFQEAQQLLQEMQQEDLSVTRLLLICNSFVASPPPEDWDGVSHLMEK